jgi:phenylalanyl-tRNA synthetase alpha chain
MSKTIDDFNNLRNTLKDAVNAVKTSEHLDKLEEVNKKYFGKHSEFALLSSQIKHLPNELKKHAGQQIGEFKKTFTNHHEQKRKVLEELLEQETLSSKKVDITAPIFQTKQGGRHPLSKIQDEIGDFFLSKGWIVAGGPEVEAQWFNFDALNLGKDHPARQEQDTFFVSGYENVDTCKDESCDKQAEKTNLVLRTHTSPMQIRSMIKYGVPIYLASIGKVYRADELDQTHTPVFTQCEGLAIGENINMGHLRGILNEFAQFMFGEKAKTRLRPSFFPFTQPSAEMDVWFENKSGGAGWIEWGGCGMVHPNVLMSCGIDPRKYSGYAFGIGIERTLQLRYQVTDMHDIVEGDIRFTNNVSNEGGLATCLS